MLEILDRNDYLFGCSENRNDIFPVGNFGVLAEEATDSFLFTHGQPVSSPFMHQQPLFISW